jgi:3',5'-cyclic-AMP phosphodiesterase
MTDLIHYVSILQLTDSHILGKPDDTLLGIDTAYYFNAVLEHAFTSQTHFDLCLLTGDLAQDPCSASYRHLLDKLEDYNIPSVCLPGNHDDYGIMQAILNTERINCRKQVFVGNWQIISLNSQIVDSPNGYLAQAELAFLEQCLKQRPDLFSLIAVHHHCIPSRTIWMDSMMIGNAQELFDLIKKYPKAKTIVNGHIHQEMDIQLDSVRVLTTPSTCFQFKPNSKSFSLDDKSPGYRWLNLYDDGSLHTGVAHIPEPLVGLEAATHGY